MNNQATPAKSGSSGTLLAASRFKVSTIIVDLIRTIIFNILLGCLIALCVVTVFLAPLGALFGVLVFLNNISVIFSIIGHCLSKIRVTDSGIYGRAGFKGFDLSYEQIANVAPEKKVLVVYTNIPKKEGSNKMKKYRVTNVKNLDEVLTAFHDQAGKLAAEKAVKAAAANTEANA